MGKLWLIKQKDGAPNLTEWQKVDFRDYCKRHPGIKFHLLPLENKRTISQNNLYWLYLTIIARETGNDADDLHSYFRDKMLPRKMVQIKGKKGEYSFEKLASTTELTKLEFGEYLDRIAITTGIPIPDPEEAGYFRG